MQLLVYTKTQNKYVKSITRQKRNWIIQVKIGNYFKKKNRDHL